MYRVLVVEDDPGFLYLEKSMRAWSECGFTVAAEAEHGRDALYLIGKEKFDLVVTDIRMPFMDGVTLLKRIRESGDQTPVIFMSSYADFEYAKEGFVHNLFDYIEKPLDEKKLTDVLLRVKKRLDEQSGPKIDGVMRDLLTELGLSSDEPFVRQLAEYCTEHYKDDLSGEELAEVMGLRADYFGKLFKQHFGITHKDFRSKVKIAYAIELLRAGTYKAYEISDMLGYPSYKYFAEKFKGITGVSPTDYKFAPKNKE